MATTMVATPTSALSRSENRDPPLSSLSSLSLSTAASGMTFFPALLTPPSSPPLESQLQTSDEGPITDSASNIPSQAPPASSIRHNPPPLSSPEPSPPLTPPPQASLSSQINVATRPIHTRLNKRILGLLPLALPPHAETPELYMRGMEAVRDIYGTLEGTVRRARGDSLEVDGSSEKDALHSVEDCFKSSIEETSSDGNPACKFNNQEDGGQMVKPRVDLNSLDLTGLLGRATRLEDDLLELKHRINPKDLHPAQKNDPSESRHQTPALTALTHRIHALASTKVVISQHHLLLAPLHQFTLALFNGGRHIRRRLFFTSPTFWSPATYHSKPPASPLLPEPSPFTLATDSSPSPYFSIPRSDQGDVDGGAADNVLTFWHTPDHDEEGAKKGFKRTFELVAAGLASWERDEVIAEAVSVMLMLEAVVEEIVRDVGTVARFGGQGV